MKDVVGISIFMGFSFGLGFLTAHEILPGKGGELRECLAKQERAYAGWNVAAEGGANCAFKLDAANFATRMCEERTEECAASLESATETMKRANKFLSEHECTPKGEK